MGGKKGCRWEERRRKKGRGVGGKNERGVGGKKGKGGVGGGIWC